MVTIPLGVLLGLIGLLVDQRKKPSIAGLAVIGGMFLLLFFGQRIVDACL